MAQAPDIEEGDVATVETAKPLASVERDRLQASREVHRLVCEVERLGEQLRTERVDHEHLVAFVSHELRTPITVLSGYVRLLLAEEVGPLGEEQRRFLVQAQYACKKLGVFVERALDATRAPHCAGSLEVCSSSLGPVLTEVAASYREVLVTRELCLDDDIDPAHVAR